MNISWILLTLNIYATIVAATTSTTATTMHEKDFRDFIEQVENLVLNTTEQALTVTTHVYRNLTKSLSPLLQQAIVPITTEYLRAVEEALACPGNYTEYRKLLRYFRRNNIQIERLRQQLQPQYPKFQFHLISNDFYNAGKNITEFDQLYMKFMLRFQFLSESLWESIPEEVKEEQKDLLEILDEISQEKELSKRDRLYDEFIEMFLFKTELDTIENRQL